MPVATPNKPLVSIEVYEEGRSGDPIPVDKGYTRHDVMALKERDAGAIEASLSNFVPYLEFLPNVGLTPRPFVKYKNTLLNQFTVSPAADWDEREEITGAPRTTYLVMFNAAAGIQYSAESNQTLPENPLVAISVTLQDNPPEWDYEGMQPFFRIEFGNQMWAIEMRQEGNFLLQNIAGQYEAVDNLGSGNARGYRDVDEILIIFRPIAGQLHVSMDGGESFSAIAKKKPEDADIYIPSGKLRFSGQGGRVAIGVHEVELRQGWYQAPDSNTFTSRLNPTATIEGTYRAPSGSSVAFSDTSSHMEQRASYRAVLTPALIPGYPLQFYAAPVLEDVTYHIPVTTLIPSIRRHRNWDRYLQGVDIDYIEELAGSTCTILLYQVPQARSFFENIDRYCFRKVNVSFGYLMSDGTVKWYRVFTGYIRSIDLNWTGVFGQSAIQIVLDNGLARYKGPEWSLLDVRPLGGRSLNSAADYVLASEGTPLNTSYRDWYSLGDVIELPAGPPTHRFELIKPEEKKFETLKRIFGYEGLELGVDHNNVIFTLPKNYVNDTDDAWTIRPYVSTSGRNDDREAAKGIQHSVDFSQRATAVMTSADDGYGNIIISYIVDTQAESNINSGRFVPWRVLVQQNEEKGCQSNILAGHAQALAIEHLRNKSTQQIETKPNLDMKRRQRMIASGFGSGSSLPDGTELVIMTIKHAFRVKESINSLSTHVGLRRRYQP